MKTILLILTICLFSFNTFANEQVIRCSLKANYEIYRGEGMVERGEGSLIAVPVEFSFFTNESAFTANYSAKQKSLKVTAKATKDNAEVEIFGITFSFHPPRGFEQEFGKETLSSYNYSYGPNRVAFMRALLKCAPPIQWDQRPVMPL